VNGSIVAGMSGGGVFDATASMHAINDWRDDDGVPVGGVVELADTPLCGKERADARLILSLLGVGGIGAAAIGSSALRRCSASAARRSASWRRFHGKLYAVAALAGVLAFLIISRGHALDRARADEARLAQICCRRARCRRPAASGLPACRRSRSERSARA
jgi:hypothetical protein